MLLKYAPRSRVLAFSPLLYRYPADWVEDGLPVHDGSLEQILSLQPDLVITGQYNAMILRQRLSQLGLRVVVFALADELDEIGNYQQHFFAAVGLQATDPATDSAKNFPPRHKRLLLLGANGIGTGQGTLEHDILQRAGWDNYLQRPGYQSLSLEQLVNDPPDAIWWSAPQSSSLANLFARHPVLADLIGEHSRQNDAHWRWQCPGPWSFELIGELAAWQKD